MLRFQGIRLLCAIACVCSIMAAGATPVRADAVDDYLMDASRGKKIAQIRLARAYYNGTDGVERDYERAHKWYLRAAKQDSLEAQVKVAEMYRNGQGVEKNMHEARTWYQKAAEQGDGDAAFELGVMFQTGEDVMTDLAAAHDWYLKAAKAGNTTAFYNLGIMYRDGDGVEADPVQAHMWMAFAAAHGVERAAPIRDDIKSRLTARQVKESADRARAWLAQ